MNKVYTIGYEGVTAQEFVAALQDAGIKLLVDCRIHVGSRKKGMSKTPLREALAAVGIDYHLDPYKRLGTPKPILRHFRETGEYDWDKYNAYLSKQGMVVAYVAYLSTLKPTCLMCYEADAGICHRRFVAKAIVAITNGKIINLKPVPWRTL